MLIEESRPWGGFTILEESSSFKVKRITVNPGHKLSLQYHHHRSEHWTIVQGLATVTLGQDVLKLKVNESIFIPLKEQHSLGNDGEEILQLIEVQIGDYLGEDDIVRLEDQYGRV